MVELIVNKEGIRRDLLAWRIKDVKDLAREYDSVFNVVLDLLNDENPHVRTNALQVLEELIKEDAVTGSKVTKVLDRVIPLTNDNEERVVLKALEVLNVLLEKGSLSEDDYERVTDALMGVLKSGIPVLGEYAAEGLGKVGVKIARLAYRLIGWLFSLIGSSKKREVQSAAITALTEMASKSEDSKVLNEIFDRMIDLVAHPDPYIAERALLSVDRLLSRSDRLSTRNKLKAIERIKSLRGDVRFGVKAARVLEKLEKSEALIARESNLIRTEEAMEATKYGPDDVEMLLDLGKPEIVVEMAKLDPLVMEKILKMLEDPDYTRRMDALWVVSRLTQYISPSDAYASLPVLAEFLKSRNTWARETAAKTLAEIYSLYPGTSRFFLSLIDLMLKSKKPFEVDGTLELLLELSDRIGGDKFKKSVLKIVLDLLEDQATRPIVLRFLAREAQRLINFETEILLALRDALKSVYGKDGGKNDEIIASLVDVIEDVLKIRRRGVVLSQ